MKETVDNLEEHSFTYSLITQGDIKFYSLTMPSDILASTCFVTSRFEDKETGFQRRLDVKKAEEIAHYIDAKQGTIPTAIILSAQPEAELKPKTGGRSLSFKAHPKAFLVIDGQHRVWGFSKAKSHLRVPVIIYTGLSKQEETRLFIDINTKQKPVPSELLLDIKELADRETEDEKVYRVLFDNFSEKENSVLLGLVSPSEKKQGKISRTTFNSAFKSIKSIFGDQPPEKIYLIINNYLYAIKDVLKDSDNELITNANTFKAIIAFLAIVAPTVKMKFDGDYSADNFSEILQPLSSLNRSTSLKNKKSYGKIVEIFDKALSQDFSL